MVRDCVGKDQIEGTENGAAETVAGSNFLLHVGRYNLLIDFGIKYSDDENEDSQPLPYDAKSIDCFHITHSHADHMGNMLKLYKAGFRGKIYSTYETFDLSRLQMTQTVSSAFIHNKWVKGKRFQSGPNKGKFIPFKPIVYTNKDINDISTLFEKYDGMPGLPYEKRIQIVKDKDTEVNATYYEAGHIPGSAQILFEITHKGKTKKLLTCRDLGRTDYKIKDHPIADIPIIRFPHTNFPKDIDIVLTEATYGDKTHAPISDSMEAYLEAINYAAKNEGQIVVPAFSIMRMQMLDCINYNLAKEGKFPDNMQLISSCPTSESIWKIFLKYIDNFDEQTKEWFTDENNNPYNFPRLIKHKKMEETIAAIKSGQCAEYLASSGMGSWGRAKTILRELISNPKNSVLSTGYASPSTIMGQIGVGKKKIYFGDEIGDIEMNAKYFRMGGLSGHADCIEMITHVNNLYDPRKDSLRRKPLEILITHGEKDSCEAQRKGFIEYGHRPENVHVMKKGQVYEFAF
jgi:metallo-beta-lactamase family protein